MLPLAESLQYVFNNRAVIPDNLFFETVIVRFDAVKNWAEKLLTFDPRLQSASREIAYQIRDAATWSDLQAVIRNASLASILEPQGFIGYERECNTNLFVKVLSSINFRVCNMRDRKKK